MSFLSIIPISKVFCLCAASCSCCFSRLHSSS